VSTAYLVDAFNLSAHRVLGINPRNGANLASITPRQDNNPIMGLEQVIAHLNLDIFNLRLR
jgi:hypothetical protein